MAGIEQQVVEMIQSLPEEVSTPDYNSVIIRLDRIIQISRPTRMYKALPFAFLKSLAEASLTSAVKYRMRAEW